MLVKVRKGELVEMSVHSFHLLSYSPFNFSLKCTEKETKEHAWKQKKE